MSGESLEVEEGVRWYAIETKPRKENVVGKRLSDLRLEVFLPWLHLRRRVGSRFQWVLDPLFPGYLFCRLDLFLSGKMARYAPGVKDFIRFGNRIAEVDGRIIQTLKERCPNGVAQIQTRIYRVGEAVMIKEGPLAGFEAIFEQEMKGSERVAVLLDLLGRSTRVVLPNSMIGPV